MRPELSKTRHRGPVIALAALVMILVATPALAVPIQWIGPTTNNLWTNKSNWDTNTVPGVGDEAKVTSGTSQTVSFNTNINAPGLTSLIISGTGGATVTLSQSLKTLTAGDETVGTGNGKGIHNQSLGTTRITDLLILGNNVNSEGTYNKSGGSFYAGRMRVGNSGKGTFNHSSSSAEVTGTDLFLGVTATGIGTYNMSSGSLKVKRDEIVGRLGTGTFKQSAGTHTIGQDLYLGADSATAKGTFTMSSGTLKVGGDEVIGNLGIGEFTQSSGSHTVGGEFDVGNNSGGVGTFNMTSGSLNVAKNAHIGSQDATGTFNQTSGSVTIGGDFILARSGAVSKGTYKMTSGSLTVKGPNGEVIGQDGTGEFTQTSGSNTVTNGPLILAKKAGSFGTYNLKSGSVTAPTIQINGSTEPGSGTGKFNVTGTATVNGDVTNDGEVKTTDANVTWNGTFTNNNSYISDPSTQTFNKDLVVNTQGFLVGTASQDLFVFKENFQNYSQNTLNWNTAVTGGPTITGAGMQFVANGDLSHDLYIPGLNKGQGADPVPRYVGNFGWGALDITGQTLNLQDGNTFNASTGLYVGGLIGVTLNVTDPTHPVATNIFNPSGGGIYLFYDPDNTLVNQYLLDVAVGPEKRIWFASGIGLLRPYHTPVPASLLLLGSGLLGLGALGWRRRKKA